MIQQVARTRAKTRRARLDRITRALRVAVPQLSQLELEQDIRGIWHLKGRYEHWRAKGAWQTEDQFSDGTLRLLGLLWSLLDGSGPLLLEEPELSLHPDVVRQIPQMFARIQRSLRRQIVVSTHSFTLLEDSGVGLDEVLMLIPSKEGTRVRRPSELDQVRELVESGMTLAEAILPHTRPEHAEQLTRFGDVDG